MARIVVIFSLCLAACEVGELPDLTGDGGGSGDAGNGCIPLAEAAAVPTGHHPPDHESRTMGCMSAGGCHNAALGLGVGAPEYSYAGLLFKADKTTPYGGASIVVKMGDKLAQAMAADNGEFAISPGAAGLDPPTLQMTAMTEASGCPNVAPMVGLIVQGGGDCNSAACHAPGSLQGVVYLP